MKGMVQAWARDTRAVVAIEFSILMPVMIVILFGSFEATRLVRASFRVTGAAQTIADLVAQQDSVSTSEMANFCVGGKLVLTPFSTTSLTASVASVTYSSTSSGRAVDWQDTTCGNGSTIGNAVSLGTAYTPNVKDSVIVARVTYSYTPLLNTFLTSAFTMTRVAYARPRNGTTVSHS